VSPRGARRKRHSLKDPQRAEAIYKVIRARLAKAQRERPFGYLVRERPDILMPSLDTKRPFFPFGDCHGDINLHSLSHSPAGCRQASHARFLSETSTYCTSSAINFRSTKNVFPFVSSSLGTEI
jgi:hypothetical protein